MALGVPWACPAAQRVLALVARGHRGTARQRAQRWGYGFLSGFNDDESELGRAIWRLTRHLRPVNVFETGVARGITTRFILEALERNGFGHLWSVDQPPPLYPRSWEQVGAAVNSNCRRRWSYIRGSNRRRLPALLSFLGAIDLFLHDSIHTEYNTCFELD